MPINLFPVGFIYQVVGACIRGAPSTHQALTF